MATGSKVGTPLLNSLLQTFEKIESEKSSVAQPLVQNTMDIVGHYFPLFYASERGPLGIWEKEVDLLDRNRMIDHYHCLIANKNDHCPSFILEWLGPH